ncbi:hypothetical protein FE840_008755 [Peteryoungia desertarenae]|uniref:Thioesterase n=1 Tax=Peteryoungia desertarenae TaxID=1813451 RepID=A0ABX6QNA7_9HYPH|nr:hypothetical protein [Peteryoungia desertarenae]QLF69625.1 hypothetical protein FE840_008755 [Peteryoungia desertarenae]
MDEIERIEVIETQVQYRDIAISGEIQTAAYVTYAEDAIRHFWRYRPPLEDEPRFAVSKLDLRIFHGLELDDQIRLTVNINKIGGKSIGFNVVIDCDDRIVADIDVIWTAHNRDTGAAVALPEDLRDWLYRYLP